MRCFLVLKCYAAAWSFRASHLNWALVANEKIAAKTECLGLIVRVLFCSILCFELREFSFAENEFRSFPSLVFCCRSRLVC